MLAKERSSNPVIPVETTQPSPATFGQWLLLGAVALLAIVIDQITKAYVAAHLDLHDSCMPIEAIEPVFRFTHVHNRGDAFGLFPQGGMFFLFVALIVSGVIIYYYRQIPGEAWLVRLALGLQLGGALGNVIDRLRLGYVVDFFHVEYWPVFNVADSCIVVGVALLALAMVIEEYRAYHEKQNASPKDDEAAGS
jgi:signal peptidase II